MKLPSRWDTPAATRVKRELAGASTIVAFARGKSFAGGGVGGVAGWAKAAPETASRRAPADGRVLVKFVASTATMPMSGCIETGSQVHAAFGFERSASESGAGFVGMSQYKDRFHHSFVL